MSTILNAILVWADTPGIEILEMTDCYVQINSQKGIATVILREDTYEVTSTSEQLKAKIEKVIERALAKEKPLGKGSVIGKNPNSDASSRTIISWNVVKPSLISSSVNLRCSRLRIPEKVACDIENFVSLQIQVAIEHCYEMLSWGYQDVE